MVQCLVCGLLLNACYHLALAWEATAGILGEDQLIAYADLKTAAAAGCECDFDRFETALKFVRQTGGSWLIVSHLAIFDFNAQCHSSLKLCCHSRPEIVALGLDLSFSTPEWKRRSSSRVVLTRK